MQKLALLIGLQPEIKRQPNSSAPILKETEIKHQIADDGLGRRVPRKPRPSGRGRGALTGRFAFPFVIWMLFNYKETIEYLTEAGSKEKPHKKRK
jgi:hypothetical protein